MTHKLTIRRVYAFSSKERQKGIKLFLASKRDLASILASHAKTR